METLLENISWAQFLATVLLISATYYSYIAYKYYPQEVRSLFIKKYPAGHNPFSFQQDAAEQVVAKHIPTNVVALTQPATLDEVTEDTFDRIEMLIEQLKPAIAGASLGTGSENQQNDLSESLQISMSTILSSFPDLRTSSFSPAIIELIQTEIKNSGSAAPSETEIMELWG